MNYSSFTKPRKPLNKVSAKQRRKIKIVREAKKQLFLDNKIYCLTCGSDDCTPAHRTKRHNIANADDTERRWILPLCKDCHWNFERLGESRNYAILTFLAECVEYEREPEVDFINMNLAELIKFADKLILETTDI